jgi:hypothetical protein
MTARVKNIFGERICNWECPKALGMYHPTDPVSLRPWFVSRVGLQVSLLLTQVSFNRRVLCTASRGHLLVPCVTAQLGTAQLQDLQRDERASGTTATHRRVPLRLDGG